MMQKKLINPLLCCGALIFSVLLGCQPEEAPTPSTNLTGTWICSETCTNPSGTSSFTIHINPSGSGYLVENFYNLGFNYSAKIQTSGSSITISNQSIAGFSVSGTGTITSPSEMSLNYQISDGSGGNADNCFATIKKQ